MSGLVGLIGKSDARRAHIQRELGVLSGVLQSAGYGSVASHVGSSGGKPFGVAMIGHGRHTADAIFAPSGADGPVGLVYDGSIFSSLTMRRGVGCALSAADVLAQYEQYGEEVFRKFSGHFFLCLWDDRKNTIYLISDNFGTKPLYIYEDPNVVVFTTNFSTLFKISNMDRSYDPQGLRDFLSLGFVSAPRTLLKRVTRIDAGSFVRISKSRVTTWNHSELSEPHIFSVRKAPQAKRILRDRFDAAVKRSLTGARAAILMDGGPASLALARALKEFGAEGEVIGLRHPDRRHDAASLRRLSDSVGFNVRHVDVGAGELGDVIGEMDTPIAEPRAWPGLILTRHARDLPLVMSSAGGAELIAPTSPDLSLDGNRREAFLAWTRKTVCDGSAEGSELHDGREANTPHSSHKYFTGHDVGAAAYRYDFRTRVPYALAAPVDRMAERLALEPRFPYLDEGVVRLVDALRRGFRDGPDDSDLLAIFGESSVLEHGFIDGPALDLGGFCLGRRDRLYDLLESVRHDEIGGVLDLAQVRNAYDLFYEGNLELARRVWTNFVLLEWLQVQTEVRQAPPAASIAVSDSQGRVDEADREMVLASGLFDPDWYLAAYPDIREKHGDPLDDFLSSGGNEGRAPGPFFSTEDYLDRYPDVRASGVNPILHFLRIGAAQGRKACTVERCNDRRLLRSSALFDAQWYLAQNPDVAKAKIDPLDHYLDMGWAESRAPSPLFDPEDYLLRNPDVANSGGNPLLHYLTSGIVEGRTIHGLEFARQRRLLKGSGLFDPVWYLETYPDVAAADVDPLDHYLEFGAAEIRSPGPRFDPVDYLARYPDVADASINPLLHYLTAGLLEGRTVRTLAFAQQRKLLDSAVSFDKAWYLEAYPDVAQAGVDPVEHYLEFGFAEGRATGRTSPNEHSN